MITTHALLYSPVPEIKDHVPVATVISSMNQETIVSYDDQFPNVKKAFPTMETELLKIHLDVLNRELRNLKKEHLDAYLESMGPQFKAYKIEIG